MFLSVHSIVALTSIKYIHNPLLLFIVNFILHYILDAIPHGDGDNIDNGFKKENLNYLILASLDVLFVLIIGITFYKTYHYNIYSIIAAISGAILPDILWGVYQVTKFKFFKWADDLNNFAHQIIKYKTNHILEYFIQFIPIIICYFLLK